MARTNPTHTQVTAITTASKTLAAANPQRSSLAMYQSTGVTMWLAVSYDGTVAAVAGQGIPLLSGVPLSLNDLAVDFGDDWTMGHVNVIAESGSGHAVGLFEAVKN
jgi:hypothetical protein